MAEIAVGEKTAKLSRNQTNKSKQTVKTTIDYLTFVIIGCLPNYSFLGSVEVGYLWLETKKNIVELSCKLGLRLTKIPGHS